MANRVYVWAPTFKGNDSPTMSLAIPWQAQSPPSEDQYQNLLEIAINSLIAQNPEQALRNLEEVSTPESPGLYPELRWYPSHQWAFHIMHSFGMQRMLTRIDWQRIDPIQELSSQDLPSFMDILQMM